MEVGAVCTSLGKTHNAPVVALLAEVRRRKSPLKAALQLFFSRVLPPLCKVHCSLGTHHSTGTVRDGSMSAGMPPVRHSPG